MAAVRPGVPAESVDAAARDVITAAGYREAFLHRTGHGIGVLTHEDPYIVGGNTRPLEPGMAFSVEPGIYLAGRHGARISVVVVTEVGAERLNRTTAICADSERVVAVGSSMPDRRLVGTDRGRLASYTDLAERVGFRRVGRTPAVRRLEQRDPATAPGSTRPARPAATAFAVEPI